MNSLSHGAGFKLMHYRANLSAPGPSPRPAPCQPSKSPHFPISSPAVHPLHEPLVVGYQLLAVLNADADVVGKVVPLGQRTLSLFHRQHVPHRVGARLLQIGEQHCILVLWQRFTSKHAGIAIPLLAPYGTALGPRAATPERVPAQLPERSSRLRVGSWRT